MRTPFTVRLLNEDHRKLKIAAAGQGRAHQDCVEDAVRLWLAEGAPVEGHEASCPLARAPREHAGAAVAVLAILQKGGPLADFLVGGLKGYARK